jgi:L-asparagine transporter-like permease
MTVMTFVNLMSARSYAEFEFWFASIKVAAILVFIAIAASYAFGWTAPHGATFGNLVDFGGFTPNGWIAVLAAVPTVFFAMTGAEITTIAAAESAQPGKAVARMSTAVIGRILIFYVISLFLIVSVTPWNTVRSGESPFTLALNTMHIPWAGEIMSAIILTAVLSCLNSAFYVSSRVLFILAERGDAPQMLVRLNARRVPMASVLIGAAAGFLGIIAATEAPQKVFDFLVSSSGALIVFVYMAIAFAQIRLRNRRDRDGEPAPAVQMWLFPWLSYGAIAGMAAVLTAMAFTPGLQQDFKFSCITLVVAILASRLLQRVRKPVMMQTVKK